MKKVLLAILLLGAVALLFAQQQRRPVGSGPGRLAGGGSGALVYAPFDLLAVYPQETSPGEYQQVDPAQLQQLADQGWQLVSVSPYIYRNEEHQNGTPSAPLVTQVYQSYYFQRARMVR